MTQWNIKHEANSKKVVFEKRITINSKRVTDDGFLQLEPGWANKSMNQLA